MINTNQNEELLDFFKALADAKRLKIVGLLAQKPHTVKQLSEALGLGVSTTSHHLSYLARVGLVIARPEGHYYWYSLQTEVLHEKAQRLLSVEAQPRSPSETSSDAYDRKVLETFTDTEGRIKAFPAQEKKFLVLLRYVVKAFEPGKRYTDKQVKKILLRYNEDVASLRRGMVEYHLMERQGGGGEYWRPEE